MPELNNTFIKGRMNKDLDDRLVPQGEYRDALNIEVSTSESSDVGTVQNLKGNNSLSSDVLSTVGQENIYNTSQITVYESVLTDFYGNLNPSQAGIRVTSDNSFRINSKTLSIQPYKTIKTTLLEVGKYYTVTLDYSLVLTDYGDSSFTYTIGLVDLDTSFMDALQVSRGTIVNDGISSGSLTKTFYCESEIFSIYVSASFSGIIENIKIVDSTALESDTSNAITVGSKADTTTDVIYNFIHKASDFKLNTFTTSTGEVKSRMLGIQSDAIIQHKPSNFEEKSINIPVITDVYKVRVRPRIGENNKIPMLDSHGVITNSEITGLPYTTNSSGQNIVQGIRPGMSVKFISEDEINLWQNFDIKVLEVGYDSVSKTGRVTITPVDSFEVFNEQAIDLNFILEFTAPRVLKFLPGTVEKESNVDNLTSPTPVNSSITAINVVDNYLYYTDNLNEPKKINIKHGIESTNSVFQHTYYRELNTIIGSNYYLEEKHITVVKAKPTSAPRLRLSNSSRKGGSAIDIRPYASNNEPQVKYIYSDISSTVIGKDVDSETVEKFNFFDNNVLNPIGFTRNIISSVERVNWRVGDTLLLTGVETQKTLNVRIVNAFINNNKFNTFNVKVVSYSDEYSSISTPTNELFIAELKFSKVLYEDNFVSFALRYKYNDNEYSAIGPYSQTAFLPSRYLYKSSVGLNESMVNTLGSIVLENIVNSNIGKDVKSIDIILRDHFTTNAYIVKTIEKTSNEWLVNSFEILSELRGTTIPSLQLLRNYDAVPIKAKAQEFIASRLMYGNYTEGYEMLDHGAIPIETSIKTDFENIVSTADEYLTATVNEGEDNDLYAINSPFFNVEDTEHGNATRFIHNFYKSPNETLDPEFDTSYQTSDGTTIYCPEDVDIISRIPGEPGTGPVFTRFLIPIFPKNEHADGNSSTSLVMPSVVDITGNSWDVGATGNYLVATGDSHSNHYNSTNNIAYSYANLDDNVKPLLYKAREAGDYKIKVSTKALVRYYYGTYLGLDSQVLQDSSRRYKDMKFRLELHKVNASGDSLGIISDSIDLISNQDGLAVSAFAQGNSYEGSKIGSSYGPDTLYQSRNGYVTYNNNQPFPNTNTPVEVEMHRKVTLAEGDYIAAFFSYQKSFYNTQFSNNPEFTTFNSQDYNIEENKSIRFALDADETFIEVTAPQTIGTIQVESPTKSVRSNRFYETGVVYSDMYGRETTVMISKDSKIEIPISYSDKKTALTCEIYSNAPYWATHYKYYVKESANKYYNLVLDACYSNEGSETDTAYVWLSFNSTDIDKVDIDDNLILKKQHGTNVAINSKVNRIKVLDLVKEATSSIDVTQDQAEGKFFIKAKRSELTNLTSSGSVIIADTDSSTPSDNGAVFEVEADTTVRDGFYWETSKAYPIVLDENNAKDYIEEGDYVQMLYFYNSGNKLFFTDASVNNFNSQNANLKVLSVEGASSFPPIINSTNSSQTCNITVSTNLENFNIPDIENTSLYCILKFIKPGGTYVTATAVSISANKIRVVPYTHPVSSITCNILNKVALPWHNCYQWYNGVETDIMRDDFTGSTLFAYTPETGKQSGFNASDYYPDYKQVTNKSDIIYSQIYNQQSNIDASNQFILADKITKRLNRSHGQINALIARNNDIIALCEDKVLKILSSGKDALFNADGNIQLTASSNVLGQSIPFVGDFGCQHPESIALDEYRIYFVDKARGSVLRLSRDGMTEISSNGMDNWFDEHLEKAQSIIGSFDDDKSEYNITIHEVISTRVNKNVYTLSFDESNNGWTSFKSFIKESGLSLNNKYYTFKNGIIYRHHSDEVLRNNFYNKQYESSITTLINMQPETVKSFNRISYEGSQAEVIKDLSDSNYRNIVPLSGWSVEDIKTDQQSGEVNEFIEKEGKWFNNIKGKQ
jgi:hypothetical protein